MIKRIITVLLLTIFVQSCEAAPQNVTQEKGDAIVFNTINAEQTVTNFSTALTKKNLDLLLSLTNQKDIYLVRIFTSGNLGGRGSPLSQSIDIKSISKELSIEIKKQTPFDLPELFTNLPISSAKTLPHRTLATEANSTHFDQWAPILKKSLIGAPETNDGNSLLLQSSKYWVYTEAQIINDTLIGSFAVFSNQNGELKLISVMELL
jgi:PBP1b-binding outer membrane lipoprotein LpoB